MRRSQGHQQGKFLPWMVWRVVVNLLQEWGNIQHERRHFIHVPAKRFHHKLLCDFLKLEIIKNRKRHCATLIPIVFYALNVKLVPISIQAGHFLAIELSNW